MLDAGHRMLDAGSRGVWVLRSLDVLWERLSAAMGRSGTPLNGITDRASGTEYQGVKTPFKNPSACRKGIAMIQSSSQKEIPAGMIDLGIGQPSPGLLPVAALVEAASHCAGRPGGILLSYGAEQGDPGFRTALAGFLAGIYGASVAPAQLLITNGASQAIDLICTLYSRPGDTILVEEPTYFLARKIFADHGLNPVALPGFTRVDCPVRTLRRHNPADCEEPWAVM